MWGLLLHLSSIVKVLTPLRGCVPQQEVCQGHVFVHTHDGHSNRLVAERYNVRQEDYTHQQHFLLFGPAQRMKESSRSEEAKSERVTHLLHSQGVD